MKWWPLAGEINIRYTHPGMYWIMMALAVGEVAFGWNFIRNDPTFAIYDGPNNLWGGIFVGLGLARLTALNVYRRLALVRASMVFSLFYMGFLAYGTTTPYREGTGSLQLPFFYALVAAIQIPLLFEPFVNPLTARLKNGKANSK